MAPKSKSPPPKSALARSAKLLGMASKLAFQEVTERIGNRLQSEPKNKTEAWLQNKLAQAQTVVEGLGNLKGAAMKAGQLLSLEGADFLPPEILKVFSQLQADAPEVDFATMKRILKKELGPDRFARIQKLEPQAIASASIGQVYRAEIDGLPVAIKIQYPGVADSIDSDLKVLKAFAKTTLKALGRDIPLDGTFAELARVLRQETQYLEELRWMEQYHTNLSHRTEWVIPKPFPELSTQKVLTMAFAPGIPFEKWLETSPKLTERQHLARSILDLYFEEFYIQGLVQTDPNPGNFLVQPNGDQPRLVLLDFGASQTYSADFRKTYLKMIHAVYAGAIPEIVRMAHLLEFLDPRESTATEKLFIDVLRLGVEPFHPEQQPFDFCNADFAKRNREALLQFTRSLQFTPPPRQVLFLHRKLGGVYGLLRKLQVSIDLRGDWEKLKNLYQ